MGRHVPRADARQRTRSHAERGVGPRREAAEHLAQRYGAATAATFDDLLERCDAVAFSVPPDVQATLAPLAARAGRHMLLEKPLARTRQRCGRHCRGCRRRRRGHTTDAHVPVHQRRCTSSSARWPVCPSGTSARPGSAAARWPARRLRLRGARPAARRCSTSPPRTGSCRGGRRTRDRGAGGGARRRRDDHDCARWRNGRTNRAVGHHTRCARPAKGGGGHRDRPVYLGRRDSWTVGRCAARNRGRVRPHRAGRVHTADRRAPRGADPTDAGGRGRVDRHRPAGIPALVVTALAVVSFREELTLPSVRVSAVRLGATGQQVGDRANRIPTQRHRRARPRPCPLRQPEQERSWACSV